MTSCIAIGCGSGCFAWLRSRLSAHCSPEAAMPSDRTDLAVVLLSIFAYALVFAMFASWFMVFGPWTKWVRFPLMLIAMFGVAYWLAHRAILHIESPNA